MTPVSPSTAPALNVVRSNGSPLHHPDPAGILTSQDTNRPSMAMGQGTPVATAAVWALLVLAVLMVRRTRVGIAPASATNFGSEVTCTASARRGRLIADMATNYSGKDVGRLRWCRNWCTDTLASVDSVAGPDPEFPGVSPWDRCRCVRLDQGTCLFPHHHDQACPREPDGASIAAAAHTAGRSDLKVGLAVAQLTDYQTCNPQLFTHISSPDSVEYALSADIQLHRRLLDRCPRAYVPFFPSLSSQTGDCNTATTGMLGAYERTAQVACELARRRAAGEPCLVVSNHWRWEWWGELMHELSGCTVAGFIDHNPYRAGAADAGHFWNVKQFVPLPYVENAHAARHAAESLPRTSLLYFRGSPTAKGLWGGAGLEFPARVQLQTILDLRDNGI